MIICGGGKHTRRSHRGRARRRWFARRRHQFGYPSFIVNCALLAESLHRVYVRIGRSGGEPGNTRVVSIVDSSRYECAGHALSQEFRRGGGTYNLTHVGGGDGVRCGGWRSVGVECADEGGEVEVLKSSVCLSRRAKEGGRCLQRCGEDVLAGATSSDQ